MVALETRFHGATNYRPSRISCRRMDGGKTVWVSYDSDKSYEQVHVPAVVKFCKDMDWHGKLVCGGTNRGYVWVWIDKPCQDFTLEV